MSLACNCSSHVNKCIGSIYCVRRAHARLRLHSVSRAGDGSAATLDLIAVWRGRFAAIASVFLHRNSAVAREKQFTINRISVRRLTKPIDVYQPPQNLVKRFKVTQRFSAPVTLPLRQLIECVKLHVAVVGFTLSRSGCAHTMLDRPRKQRPASGLPATVSSSQERERVLRQSLCDWARCTGEKICYTANDCNGALLELRYTAFSVCGIFPSQQFLLQVALRPTRSIS